tara:strand:- start:173 stop:460 length:288 start_codon:yes stop_codon:yes gene_type:complete
MPKNAGYKIKPKLQGGGGDKVMVNTPQYRGVAPGMYRTGKEIYRTGGEDDVVPSEEVTDSSVITNPDLSAPIDPMGGIATSVATDPTAWMGAFKK